MASSHPPSETKNVALITGAAVRIGAAIATHLHTLGMRVVLHYHQSGAAAQALANRLNNVRPQSAIALSADIRNAEGCEQLLAQASAWQGRLDVLVNNASTFYPTPIGSGRESDWDDLIGTNLKGPFFLAQAATPWLRKHNGSIVNIIDAYATKPYPEHAIYTAAKAGLLSLTRSLALDLAPEIRVNAVAPGSILWPTTEPDAQTKAATLGQIPLQRMGSPEQIARAVAYFITEGSYVTGQTLAVDGGASFT